MVKKNNKGFTLVELLAVIAILGLLTVFVVPQVYSLVNDNRKKIYVQDAKKLVTQARYTMNAKNIKIEKPENGECIVFSMKYLSTSEFQSPPNGGMYLTEGSFVVVKNVGGEFKYSVMIVEKTKDGMYMGVRLTDEDALDEFPTNTLVETFNENEVGYIDESASFLNNGDVINAAYINRNIRKSTGEPLGDWIDDDDSIIGYYNNDEVEDKPLTDTRAPKITAKFNSSGALTTTLSIVASDSDNATNELLVCVKVSDTSTDTYADPTNASDRSAYCSNYGNDRFFTKDINFASSGFSYDEKKIAYVYIVVSDPSNNITRKKMTYEIHENEKPVIDTYRVESNDGGIVNLPTAKVTLFASDDMTAMDDLLVCFLQDNPTSETCSTYKKYSEYFNKSGVYLYTFKDSGGNPIIIPDGQKHNLKVFVQDNLGVTVSQSRDYALYSNGAPVITDYSLAPLYLKGASGNAIGLSLSAQYSITVVDDLATPEEIEVIIEEVGTTNVIHMYLSDYMNGSHVYNFEGVYDGSDHQLKIYVKDNYGIESEPVYLTLTGLYDNQPPTIRELKVESDGYACSGTNTCTEVSRYGGSYKTELTLTVSDDITPADDLKVCVSENRYDCDISKLETTNFVSYSKFNRSFTFSKGDLDEDLKYPSPQLVKHLYATVVDPYGEYMEYSVESPVSYRLYQNQDPYFSGAYSVNSSTVSGNVATVKLGLANFDLKDDFSNATAKFCYTVDGGAERCTSYQNFDTLKETLSNSFTFKNADGSNIIYSGQTIVTYFKGKDNYGKECTSQTVNYSLFTDSAPKIKSVSLASKESGYNSNKVVVTFNVEDFNDTYSVCVTSASSCPESDYVLNTNNTAFSGNATSNYSIIFDGHEKEGWSETYEEENTSKVLNFYVRDSHGNVASKELSYEVYELCSNEGKRKQLTDNPDYQFDTETNLGVPITAANCEGACYSQVKNTNTSTHRNYFFDQNSVSGIYKATIKYEDLLVKKECERPSQVEMKCNNVACFNTGSTTNKNFIALKLENENELWTYTREDILATVERTDPRCETNSGGTVYYNENDYRCEESGGSYTFCSTQPPTYCTRLTNEEEAAVEARNQEIQDDYDARLALYNSSILSIRRIKWDNYNDALDDYNANVRACEDENDRNEKTFLQNKEAVWLDIVALIRQERAELKLICDELNLKTPEEQEATMDKCFTNTLCQQISACEASEDPIVNGYYCYRVLDNEPLPDVENLLAYDETTLNMCGDLEVTSADLEFCELFEMYEEPCEGYDYYDEDEVLRLRRIDFDENYGTFEPNPCDFEEPVAPDVCITGNPKPSYCSEPENKLGLCSKEDQVNTTLDYCEGFEELTKPEDPVFETFGPTERAAFYATCLDDATSSCNALLSSFCSTPEEQRKYVVSCESSDKDTGPFWCRDSGIAGTYCSDGYTEDSCATSGAEDCHRICYQTVDCSTNTVSRAGTFLCKGYYKVYQGTVVNNEIQLQETGMRICPDIYRLYPGKYQFKSNTDTPYIRFNPSEVAGGA